MKSSAHLFYGIIIGILLFASTGSFKEDKAEFKTEEIRTLVGKYDFQINEEITKLKEDGWTIIDWEIEQDLSRKFNFHNLLIGK